MTLRGGEINGAGEAEQRRASFVACACIYPVSGAALAGRARAFAGSAPRGAQPVLRRAIWCVGSLASAVALHRGLQRCSAVLYSASASRQHTQTRRIQARTCNEPLR